MKDEGDTCKTERQMDRQSSIKIIFGKSIKLEKPDLGLKLLVYTACLCYFVYLTESQVDKAGLMCMISLV